MYNIILNNVTKKYEYSELIKIFLPEEEFKVHALEIRQDEYITQSELDSISNKLDNRLVFWLEDDSKKAKNALKAEIYDKLCEITGKRPEWGILTGVRPVKFAGEQFERQHMSYDEVRTMLTGDFRLSGEKADLILDIYAYQQKQTGIPAGNSAGIYIGIPFCPTRCVYCSFASNPADEKGIETYLAALHREIREVGRLNEGVYDIESVYIGGGTPTTLSAAQLDEILTLTEQSFDLSHCREFCVEAGRPDTITEDKIKVIKQHNVDRISINPQSMKEETLEAIGRKHSTEDIYRAFELARKHNIKYINCDLIAGLPGEDTEDFINTLDAIIALEAENITVHTLAVKRASKLIDIDKDYHYKQADTVRDMLKHGRVKLDDAGYIPYYLYRQKHMAGSFENTGYCKDDTPSVYNIRIMEEHQSIIAMGAGGISKKYYPDENRLERVPNVTNYEIYIERIDEMIQRKKDKLFRR